MSGPELPAAPPTAYIVRQLIRGAALWLLVRLTITAVTLGAVLMLAPPQSLLVVIAASALAYVDVRVMRETVFHANLGIAPSFAPACAAAAALVLEIATAVLT